MFDIEIKDISKSFDKGTIKALQDISLTVKKGELFGLIGSDGAGKTTLFRILTTLLLADKGTAKVLGFDVIKDYRKIRSSVGYMPGKFSLYPDLSVEENLNFFATIFNTTVKQNYNLIKNIYVQLEPFKNRKAGALSGGMKQKLALCCALINHPKILFLDEPTTGVDTVSRKEFWEMLKELKKEGITIFVSTPYMDEANLCERIALIQKGEILTIDTPKKIEESYPKPLFEIKSSEMIRLLDELKTIPEIDSVFSFGEFHHISFAENKNIHKEIEILKQKLSSLNFEDIEIHEIKASIEDSFIELMNKQQRNEY
ncbi:MAG: ABC transporter ATP-binding protein [Flavobacteriales bacterium]|nr:ABC transporter ATP-binding protein [Flavobacteriales bacterium]